MIEKQPASDGPVTQEQLQQDFLRLLRDNPEGVSEEHLFEFSDFVHRATIDWGLLDLFRKGELRATFLKGELTFSLRDQESRADA